MDDLFIKRELLPPRIKHDLIPSRRHLTLFLYFVVQILGELGQHIAQIGVLLRQLLSILQVSIRCHSVLNTLGEYCIYICLRNTRSFFLFSSLRIISHLRSALDRLEAFCNIKFICDFSQSESFNLRHSLAENFRKFVLFCQIAELQETKSFTAFFSDAF